MSDFALHSLKELAGLADGGETRQGVAGSYHGHCIKGL